MNGKDFPSEVVHMLRAKHHRNIIQLYDCEIDAERMVMVLERPDPTMDLFDLMQRATPLTERAAKLIGKQLIQAVMHCHSVGVNHGDIKEENILLEPRTGRAVLIDFGLADDFGDGLLLEPYGE